MKTPKREYKNPADKFPGDIESDSWEADYQVQDSRWKRKNKISQLKRTIARMTDESRKFRKLWLGKHLKDFSAEWEAFMLLRRLKTPAEDADSEEKLDYWLTLRKACTLLLDASCLAAIDYSKAKQKRKIKQ